MILYSKREPLDMHFLQCRILQFTEIHTIVNFYVVDRTNIFTIFT